MNRKMFVSAVVLLVASLAPMFAQDDLSAIPHFYRVSDAIWAGGQPTPDQLASLARHGVKVVINLRLPGEGNDQGIREAAQLKELGVKYFNLPVVYAEPKSADVDEFLKVTDVEL